MGTLLFRSGDQQLEWPQSLSLQISASGSRANASQHYRELSNQQLWKGISLIVLVPLCLNLSAYLHAVLTQSPGFGKTPASPHQAQTAIRRSPSLSSASLRMQVVSCTPAGCVPWGARTSPLEMPGSLHPRAPSLSSSKSALKSGEVTQPLSHPSGSCSGIFCPFPFPKEKCSCAQPRFAAL